MGESRTEGLLLLLTGIVFLLMVAIIGLFLRMNQLQREVLAALEPLRPAPHLSGLSPGTEAPAFTLPDLSGRSVSLEALAGRRVLLVFTSPRCPACREMYPHLRAFAEAHPEVAVVMISLGTGEENRAVVEEYGLAFPVLEGSGEVRASCLSALLNCDPCGWIEFTAKNAKGAKIFYLCVLCALCGFPIAQVAKIVRR